MDSLTHVVTGAVIARALDDKKVGNWGTVAGLAMGIFPDLDFVLGLFNRQFHLQYHRGFTHSLLLIPFYSLFFSWLLVKISKRNSFWSFYRICFLVLLSHVLLDLLTSYGTMIFSPFFEHRFAWDLIFIVDSIFSGILFFPWVISLFWRSKAQWFCRASLVLLAAYILFCWTEHHRAIGLAKGFARNLNEPVLDMAALPQPLSPFRWSNYIETRDKVYQGFVDFRGKGPSSPGGLQGEIGLHYFPFFRRWGNLSGIYQPPARVYYLSWQKSDGSPWVRKALATNGAKFYYWFARFPIARSVNSKDGRHRVELTDVRFLVPSVRMPFVYYIEFDASGKIQSEGFMGDRGREK